MPDVRWPLGKWERCGSVMKFGELREVRCDLDEGHAFEHWAAITVTWDDAETKGSE